MPVWTARCRNQDPGCVSMGAIQRGTSWATIPKTLNRARTVRAPCDNAPQDSLSATRRSFQEHAPCRLCPVLCILCPAPLHDTPFAFHTLPLPHALCIVYRDVDPLYENKFLQSTTKLAQMTALLHFTLATLAVVVYFGRVPAPSADGAGHGFVHCPVHRDKGRRTTTLGALCSTSVGVVPILSVCISCCSAAA